MWRGGKVGIQLKMLGLLGCVSPCTCLALWLAPGMLLDPSLLAHP